MSAPRPWLELNRRHLLAALAGVRGAIERHVAAMKEAALPPAAEAAPRDDSQEWEAEAGSTGAHRPPMALDLLVQRFGLSTFERDVVLLAAGPELEARFETLLAAVNGEARTWPSFSLALAALPGAHWSAVTPASPLRRWRLVELGAGGGLMSSPLRIDERVLHFLVGAPHPDERLRGVCVPLERGVLVPAARRAAAAELATRWLGRPDGRPTPVLALHGGDAALRRTLAGELAQAIGCQALLVRSDAFPAAADERVDLVRLLERECLLSGALLVAELEDPASERGSARALAGLLAGAAVPVIVSSDQPAPIARSLAQEVLPLSHSELRDAWRQALGERASSLNGALDRVTEQFRLDLDGVAVIGSELRARGKDGEAQGNDTRLWALCRGQARPRLDGLAERIVAAATWADLVLPPGELEALRAIGLHLRHRGLVQRQWGFADRSGRGQGITALFAGPSGTGKTMAAEVLANDLELDLYRIDLSQVVSKFIGETEKNLRRVFDAAEGASAILLFDEADALFGKRSEVKDSHDRYANIEVSYLLQRMEAYHGLAILTTNLASAIDAAFLRRLRFSITFPFPDAGARADIWRRVFPAAAPTSDLNFQHLARLNVAGGNIRNIALHAAYFAADAGEAVRMPHLLRAARLEYGKLDRPLSDTEKGAWA